MDAGNGAGGARGGEMDEFRGFSRAAYGKTGIAGGGLAEPRVTDRKMSRNCTRMFRKNPPPVCYRPVPFDPKYSRPLSVSLVNS